MYNVYTLFFRSNNTPSFGSLAQSDNNQVNALGGGSTSFPGSNNLFSGGGLSGSSMGFTGGAGFSGGSGAQFSTYRK